MKPYNVEFFTQDFLMVGSTNVNEFTYKEDYLSADENEITVLSVKGIEKENYIRINRGEEEYVGVVTQVTYGTDQSKKLVSVSFKPLLELLNTDILFEVSRQLTGTLEGFIREKITEMFIENEDKAQNITGLSVKTVSATPDWYFHITPKEAGGRYNIVNLMDSVIIPAMEKYGVLVKPVFDVQNRQIRMEIGKAARDVFTIEADLPNVIRKQITIKSLSSDVNKLVIYDAADYETKRTYFLHTDLSYDTKDKDRITPVNCEITSVEVEEGHSFESAASGEASNRFANLSYKNLIEITVMKKDALVHPEEMPYGQVVRIISEGKAYTSILTGREVSDTIKLIFGTVRLDLTKVLRRK